MKNKIITKADLASWVDSLIKKNHLVGIKHKEAGKFEFAKLSSSSELRLDYDVAITPPKKYFQPPKETLLTFTVGKKISASPVTESEDLVLFGIHPYDMKALNQMDKVFEDNNKDTNYLGRRAKAVVVGVDPAAASKWAFWSEMGVSTVDKGYDVWLTDLGDKYFAEVATKKGEELIKSAKTTDASDADLKKRENVRNNLSKLCKSDRKLKASVKDLTSLFNSSYENEIWEKRAEKCYSCGSCNLVCPTCYCFDVREDLNLDLQGGKRVRYWDGCLLEDFAMVGHGENFREERSERFRHRLFRKMSYMISKVNDLACVGCGRCSSVCLPDIADPVKIINELKEGK